MTSQAQPTMVNDFKDEVPPGLRAKYVEQDIIPLWEADDSVLRGGPTERGKVWHWADLKPLVEETSMIVTPSIVERRVLQLRNRDLRSPFTSSTGLINATLQSTRPGENARPHRHTMNAMRFALEGSTGETVVDGKPCLMTPGDLIITPAWTWHGHRNNGDEHTIWLDILDVPVHVVLGVAKFQPGPAHTSFPDFADSLFEVAGMVPVLPEAGTLPHSPRFRYPWADTLAALAAAPAREDGSKRVRYVNPINGGPVMALLDCFAIELEEGQETIPTRSSAHAICSVVEGQGETIVDGASRHTLSWSQKDIFTVPQHSWTSFRAVGGKARLFMATNRELYRRLGMLVEEQDPARRGEPASA